jgi:hypothetical protein
MLRYAIRPSVIVIFFTTFTVFIAAGYAQEHLFGVKGFVVDELGAVISTAEVTFKGESGTILGHTGMDGSVYVNLGAGKYVVTISVPGFATAKLVDFSVSGPNADAFRVSLTADPISWGSGSPNVGPLVEAPTVPSELPDVIVDEAARTSSLAAQPATTKRRSMRCLYLWKCSASQQ